MGSLNIKVGASVDQSLSTAFRPLVDGAKRARATIDAEMKRSGVAIGSEARKGAKDAEAAFRALEQELKGELPKAMGAGTAAIKNFAREAKTDFAAVKRNFADLANDAERQLRKISSAQKNQKSLGSRLFEAGGGMAGVKAGLTRGGRMALGIGKAAAGAAFELGSSYARGIGVETDLSSIFKKNADLETLATSLSNSGLIAGDARNGTRVDPKTLMQEALSTGKATGVDANAALEGLAKFTAKTGDLATGRELMKDLSIFAKATGTELDDMVDAAGDVAAALPNTADKGKVVSSVMRSIAGQGKLGAVEIKDLATQMAKLAANAGQIEGKAGQNIVTLGAFAQEARQRGGASSATQAATSVASLINTFKTPARVAAFKAATGKSAFTSDGMLRDPQELVLEALRATGMNPERFKKIFANVQGARAVEGFATVYRQHGGGAAGEAAVVAEFERLKNAAIQDTEVMASFAAQMKTGQSQADVFNNSIRETAIRLQETLAPAAMQLAPVLLDLASKGGHVVEWLVGHQAALRQAQDQNRKDVDSAITNTEKQLANGEIIDGQQKINQQAEQEAQAIAIRRQTDAEVANRDKMGGVTRAVLKAGDYLPGMALLNYMTGGATSGSGIVAKEDATIAEKEAQARESRERWEQMAGLNKRVGDLIRDHVIHVRVVEPIPGSASPPGTPSAGRQPSPEEKAGQR